MSNEVFANGREISCKSGDGKVTAAFPDVCLTPPSPPAGPLPIPYPLFAFSKDTAGGSKTVKVARKEVMLKDKSYFKKSKGDEAATRSQGMGVITHTIQGKVYFISWSPDVVIEGENVVRHLDMTTSNHASPNGNESAPMAELESQTLAENCDDANTAAVEANDDFPESMQRGDYAVSGGKFVPSVPDDLAPGILYGSNRVSASMILPGRKWEEYSAGISRGDPSNVQNCDGTQHSYTDNAYNPNEGHAEAKMLEDLFANGRPQGTLYLKTFWKKDGQWINDPCDECKKLFKTALEGCDDFQVIDCATGEPIKFD